MVRDDGKGACTLVRQVEVIEQFFQTGEFTES